MGCKKCLHIHICIRWLCMTWDTFSPRPLFPTMSKCGTNLKSEKFLILWSIWKCWSITSSRTARFSGIWAPFYIVFPRMLGFLSCSSGRLPPRIPRIRVPWLSLLRWLPRILWPLLSLGRLPRILWPTRILLNLRNEHLANSVDHIGRCLCYSLDDRATQVVIDWEKDARIRERVRILETWISAQVSAKRMFVFAVS